MGLGERGKHRIGCAGSASILMRRKGSRPGALCRMASPLGFPDSILFLQGDASCHTESISRCVCGIALPLPADSGLGNQELRLDNLLCSFDDSGRKHGKIQGEMPAGKGRTGNRTGRPEGGTSTGSRE